MKRKKDNLNSTGTKQPRTCSFEKKPSTCIKQPSTGIKRFRTGTKQPSTDTKQLCTGKKQPSTCIIQSN